MKLLSVLLSGCLAFLSGFSPASAWAQRALPSPSFGTRVQVQLPGSLPLGGEASASALSSPEGLSFSDALPSASPEIANPAAQRASAPEASATPVPEAAQAVSELRPPAPQSPQDSARGRLEAARELAGERQPSAASWQNFWQGLKGRPSGAESVFAPAEAARSIPEARLRRLARSSAPQASAWTPPLLAAAGAPVLQTLLPYIPAAVTLLTTLFATQLTNRGLGVLWRRKGWHKDPHKKNVLTSVRLISDITLWIAGTIIAFKVGHMDLGAAMTGLVSSFGLSAMLQEFLPDYIYKVLFLRLPPFLGKPLKTDDVIGIGDGEYIIRDMNYYLVAEKIGELKTHHFPLGYTQVMSRPITVWELVDENNPDLLTAAFAEHQAPQPAPKPPRPGWLRHALRLAAWGAGLAGIFLLRGTIPGVTPYLFALAALVGTWLLEKTTRHVLMLIAAKRGQDTSSFSLSRMLLSALHYLVGIPLALYLGGVDVVTLSVTFGVLTLSVAISLTTLLKNLTKAVKIRLVPPSFQIGDSIQIKGKEGVVEDIRWYYVKLDPGGEPVAMPDGKKYKRKIFLPYPVFSDTEVQILKEYMKPKLPILP